MMKSSFKEEIKEEADECYEKKDCCRFSASLPARAVPAGVRYLRVNRGESATGSHESPQHYHWDENTEWRYFRLAGGKGWNEVMR